MPCACCVADAAVSLHTTLRGGWQQARGKAHASPGGVSGAVALAVGSVVLGSGGLRLERGEIAAVPPVLAPSQSVSSLPLDSLGVRRTDTALEEAAA